MPASLRLLRRPCSYYHRSQIGIFHVYFSKIQFARAADQNVCLRFCRAGAARRTRNFYYDRVKNFFIARKGWVPKTPPRTPKGPAAAGLDTSPGFQSSVQRFYRFP